jgi:hypothetical protein
MTVATRTAREAGERVILDQPELMESERFAFALQAAAIEALEGIGLKLAEELINEQE